MRARARHRIAYGGHYYSAGDVFRISDADIVELSQYCDLLDSDNEPEPEPEKRRGGRQRKDTAD